MKVTVCQLDPREDHADACLAALNTHMATENSEFVLLPEMCFSEWLAAAPTPDPARWERAALRHEDHIHRLWELDAAAVVGTRPIVNDLGSRRNQAYLWTRDRRAAVPIREKYYLPDEAGYWEHSWYDR